MTTAAFYGWFPLYLPELFPSRSRATEQWVGNNLGRFFAAFGLDYARMDGVIYLVGMLAIWLAPETKGKSLTD